MYRIAQCAATRLSCSIGFSAEKSVGHQHIKQPGVCEASTTVDSAYVQGLRTSMFLPANLRVSVTATLPLLAADVAEAAAFAAAIAAAAADTAAFGSGT